MPVPSQRYPAPRDWLPLHTYPPGSLSGFPVRSSRRMLGRALAAPPQVLLSGADSHSDTAGGDTQ